jgi:3-oxoacyl-[acyl-carrier protein] reductase
VTVVSERTDLLDLGGRVVLVTGAGQGVGAATARCLAAHGGRVVVNDFVVERAKAVAAEISGEGGDAIGVQGGCTRFDDVERVVAEGTSAFGAVNVLVNNAGNAGADSQGLTDRAFWEKDPAEWEPFLRVNLYGVLNSCRAVLPGMIEAGQGGRVVTVISDAGRVGEAGLEASRP